MAMEVQAKYLGEDKNGYYNVNVRTANPTGNLGDAGVIRRFENKEEAKAYAEIVNETGEDVFVKKQPEKAEKPVRHEGDDFVCEGKKECPKISWARAAFSRLTDEQIKTINETGKLPQGVKVVRDGMGGYTLSNNYGGLVTGTRTIPEGFEMKKDWAGFTVIVPKDTESIFVKDVA